MRLSVFYDHILDAAAQTKRPAAEIAAECKSLGIDGLEMRLSHFEADEENIRRMLRETGLCISSFYDFFDYGKDSDLTRGKKLLDTAEELHVKRALFVPGELTPKEAELLNSCSDSEEKTAAFMEKNLSVRRMREALSELCAYAKPKGITISLEDFDGPVQPFAQIFQLKWFMEQVSGLGFTLDMGNFAYSDENVEEAYRVLGKYVVHVHCKDRGLEPGVNGRWNKGLASCAVGDGYLPVGKLVAALKESGYGGYLAIEHFGMADELTAIRRSAAYLGQFL